MHIIYIAFVCILPVFIIVHLNQQRRSQQNLIAQATLSGPRSWIACLEHVDQWDHFKRFGLRSNCSGSTLPGTWASSLGFAVV